MVGRAINHPWPLLIQGGESFSWFPGALQQAGMSDCFGDLSAPGRRLGVRASCRLFARIPGGRLALPHSKALRRLHNQIPGARSGWNCPCQEEDVPRKEQSVGDIINPLSSGPPMGPRF